MVGLTCLKVMRSSLLSSDVNECVENPCHNGATCNDRVGYFTCTCPPQFTGSRCEVGEWLSTDTYFFRYGQLVGGGGGTSTVAFTLCVQAPV